MMLTHGMLAQWQLETEVAEKIMAAVEEERCLARQEAAALTTERDALLHRVEDAQRLQQEAQEAKAAYESYLLASEEAHRAKVGKEVMRELLREAGCNPHAVELVAGQISPDAFVWEGGKPANAKALAEGLREQFGGLFAREEVIPTGKMAPPLAMGGALSAGDIAHMSAEDINSNWNLVKDVLTKGAM